MENQNEATSVVLSREESAKNYLICMALGLVILQHRLIWFVGVTGKSRSTRNGLRTARNSN